MAPLCRSILLLQSLRACFALTDSACEAGACPAEEGDETGLLALRMAARQPAKTTTTRPPFNIPAVGIEPQLKACLKRQLDPAVRVEYPTGPANASDLWALHNDRVSRRMQPRAVVFPRNAQDTEAAVKCAVEAQVSVSGQSGRHSYEAYCTSGCLLINTYLMKSVRIDSEAQTGVLGAGLNLGQAYTYLNDAGFTIPGGTCPTVGLAGLTLGGGKGPLTRLNGLLIDSVLGVEAVLSNGTYVKADAEQFADILWLAKGGGGNTFPGIVLAFTFKLTPVPSVISEVKYHWRIFEDESCERTHEPCVQPGRNALKVWQDNYVSHPDRRVYVRLEFFPYFEILVNETRKRVPAVAMIFKFIGMSAKESMPNVQPALRALGEPLKQSRWTNLSYIQSVMLGGGIGQVEGTNGTCPMEYDMSPEAARMAFTMPVPANCHWKIRMKDPTCAGVPQNQRTLENPIFCSYDSDFTTSLKYRAMVMRKLSDDAMDELLRMVSLAPDFDDLSSDFYMQMDPTGGAAGEVPNHATPYPWRSEEEMTMQVIAKWPGNKLNPLLQTYNFALISAMQPYVGTRNYYNYLDSEMPGGAVPLFSYFGTNAKRVLEVRRKYTDLRVDNGQEWELKPARSNQSYGLQPWVPLPEDLRVGADRADNLVYAATAEKNYKNLMR